MWYRFLPGLGETSKPEITRRGLISVKFGRVVADWDEFCC